MSAPQAMETRTAQLDPETRRRGLLGMSRVMIAVWSLAVFGALLTWLSFGGWAGAGGGFAVLGATGAATTRFSDGPSYAEAGVSWWRERRRRARGEHIYWSVRDRGEDTGVPAGNYQPEADPGWEHPVPLGRIEPLPLSGTGFDELFILRHANPGELDYLSVVLQVQGIKAGLRSSPAYAVNWQSYGYFQSELAKTGSFIRGIQQLHRSVSYDMTPHIEWYKSQIAASDGRLSDVVDSYWDILEQIAPLAEEHRVWVVAKIPIDGRFIAEAAGRDSWGEGRRAEVGWASVVKDELERLEALLRGAGLGEVTVLGERRTCAVSRALMDPGFELDDDRDVDWPSCWQSYFGDHDHVVVNDRWYTRVAHIPPGGIAPAPLGPLWLHPLLVGVEADEGTDEQSRAATIRTVCVRMDFIPDYAARAQAVNDLTQDAAAAMTDRKKGKIDDGTGEVMLTASQRRRRDLSPGSGVHGLSWSMWLSVTGRDPEDLRRACVRISDAAGRSAISKLDWQDQRHDVAQVATLPLCRGMAGSKSARTA